MALLSKEDRRKRFKYLGMEYNTENIKKFQKQYMRKKDVDGNYGPDTDKVLRHVYNVTRYAPNFRPEEFKCECGGKYCTGYPSYMKKVELEHLQRIRNYYKKPMLVTCGLRCKPYNNSLAGSIPNSLHLSGYACDFYMGGVTDTLSNRKKAIKWIKTQPNHHYTYGDGINSNGYAVSAKYMGNALHTDTSKPAKKEKTVQDKICEWCKKTAASKKYKYVFFNTKYGQECAICHPHNGKNKGWQCIGFTAASWRHGGGIKIKCRCDAITDQIYNKLLKVSMEEAKKIVQERLGIKDIKIIRNGGKRIPFSKLKPGDWIAYYTSDGYKHTGVYVGNGKIADCTSRRTPNIKYGVESYPGMKIKLAIRYTGK
jgi:hypothetical protein